MFVEIFVLGCLKQELNVGIIRWGTLRYCRCRDQEAVGSKHCWIVIAMWVLTERFSRFWIEEKTFLQSFRLLIEFIILIGLRALQRTNALLQLDLNGCLTRYKTQNLNHYRAAEPITYGYYRVLNPILLQGLLDNHKEIVDYFNQRGVSAIFLFRRNPLRRMVSVLANSYDRYAKLLNGTHKSHVHSLEEVYIMHTNILFSLDSWFQMVSWFFQFHCRQMHFPSISR